MGKATSKLTAAFSRPVKNYNVESRAFKEISMDKPTQAPVYPSYEKIMREIKNDPDLLNKGKLSPEEIKNFSQVYVTSTGDNPVIKAKQKLPEDRATHEHFYAFEDVGKVPPGKLSLRQMVDLIDKHATNPTENTKEVLAAEYNLSAQSTENLLEYYRTFRLFADTPSQKSILQKAKDHLQMPILEKNVESKPVTLAKRMSTEQLDEKLVDKLSDKPKVKLAPLSNSKRNTPG